MSKLRDVTLRKSYSGVAQCEVPTTSEPAIHATTVNIELTAEGIYVIEATLMIAGEIIDRTQLRFTVTTSSPLERLRPELPRYLADRLADLQSLHAESDGLSIVLENRTRPAVLTTLTPLRLDGLTLPRHEVQIETHAGRAQLTRRLDFPLGRRMRVYVVTGQPPPAGGHALEVDIGVAGVGSGRVVIEGTV